LKKAIYIIFGILVIADILFEFFKIGVPHFLVKNFIPFFLIMILTYYRELKFTKSDYWVILSYILLLAGLNLGYYFFKEKYYLPLVMVVYFLEIQLQIKVLKNYSNVILSSFKQDFLKLLIILTLGLFIIVLIFPELSFINQALLFATILQHAFFISIVFQNKRFSKEISISLWLLILSDLYSLGHLLFFRNPFDYALTMVPVYFSKFFFLIGYLKLKKLITNEK